MQYRLIGFVLLFACYQLAQACIMFWQSVAGFFLFHAGFLLTAWWLGHRQFGNGLAAYGLGMSRRVVHWLLWGVVAGLSLYGVTYWLGLVLGLIQVATFPPFEQIYSALALFVFGVAFSSLAEDILTRGYVYAHNRLPLSLFVLLSAGIYVLNHIHRLGSGAETWIYLFLLGLVFVIPLIRSGQLWFTAAMHWAGNSLFFWLYELTPTSEVEGAAMSPNQLFSLVLGCCALVGALVLWLESKKQAGMTPA